eukprot:1911231-Ditylum_brightwellii.AAC.1
MSGTDEAYTSIEAKPSNDGDEDKEYRSIKEKIQRKKGTIVPRKSRRQHNGGVRKKYSMREIHQDWKLHLQTCSNDGLSAVQKQNQGAISSLDASDTKKHTEPTISSLDARDTKKNTEPSICFISPSEQNKFQIPNNLLCRECVDKDKAKKKKV